MLRRYGKTIDDADCRQIACLIRSGALAQVESLRLSINQISDQDVEEIASALRSRPLPNLLRLWLSNNKVRSRGSLTHAASSHGWCAFLRQDWPLADRRRRDGQLVPRVRRAAALARTLPARRLVTIASGPAYLLAMLPRWAQRLGPLAPESGDNLS